MAMKSPTEFVQLYIGKAIDYDHAYGVQCVDGAKVAYVYMGVPAIPCPNNWAESYWTCKDENGNIDQSTKEWQEAYFDKITDPAEFRDGDIVIWPRGCASHTDSHVAMYYHGQEFGERQYEDNRAFCLKNTVFSDALGALRWRGWNRLPEYESDLTINGHLYHMYGQAAGLRTVVISPGLNQVAKIRDLDVDFEVFAKICSCNFFQNDPENPAGRPYGETYGDISAPLCGVYQNLPSQDAVMFFDLETGGYGDCINHSIDPEHNVFSPSLIYPRGKNVQYARMVGLGQATLKSTYTFILRYDDGSFCFGLTDGELTPNEVVADMRCISDPEIIAFLDGGGSAQMMRYITKDKRVEYTRETPRATAGCIAMIGKPVTKPAENTTAPSQTPAFPAESDEKEKDEGKPMEEIKPQEQPEMRPVEGWKDPEEVSNGRTIRERISALLSVKSILTLVLTGVFAFLVVSQIVVPDYFQEIYKIVIMFFFGYQSGKAMSGK